MRSSGAEIGFGQDPDGDRLAVADETGRVLDNDDVLALAVDAALRRLPGDVVVNLTTSSVIDEVAAAHGRRVYRTPVGEANVVEMMQAVKAVIGGEGVERRHHFSRRASLPRQLYGHGVPAGAHGGNRRTDFRAGRRACRGFIASWARSPTSTGVWAR